jgi:hypothetical protein
MMRELYSIADVVGPRFFNDWKGEQNYFLYLQAESLKRFMSLWDYNFVGWPDYSEHPLRKPEIAAGVEEEFRSPRSSVHPFLLPKPEAIAMFEDVAVTQYFWRETDDTSPTKYRTTHVWQKGPEGWRIISGMHSAVPHSSDATLRARGPV